MPENPISSTKPGTHGGTRPGAGRKFCFREPTQPIRIPLSLLPTVRGLLAQRQAGEAKIPPEGLQLFARYPTTIPLPLYSSRIAAGFPSPADDHIDDTIDLNEQLVQHPAATFFVRVQGHSMTGVGIHHGDLLVIDRSLEPKSGSIVVAVVNGELTVKRLLIEGEKVSLVPENPAFQPLEIREGMELVIWGVVAHSVRSF
jgi:DNA polymerase V